MAQENPYAKYVPAQPAPQVPPPVTNNAPPPFIGGTVSPTKQAADARDQTRTTLAVNGAARDDRRETRDVTKVKFDQESKLRDDFNMNPQVKAYRNSMPMLSQALRAPKNGQGDLSVIYAYANLMDPESVVREGEMDMVNLSSPLAQSTYQRLKGQLDSSGRLPPETRRNLDQEMIRTTQARRKAYDAQFKDYGARAGQYGLDPFAVVGTHAGEMFRAEMQDYDKERGLGRFSAQGGAQSVPDSPGTYRPDGTPVDPSQLEAGPGPNDVWIVRQPDGSVVNWETISGYGGGEVTPKEWMSDEARLNGMDQVDGNDPAYMQFAAGVGDIVEGGINNTVGLVANPINTTLFRALGYDNYTSDIGQTARDALGLPEGNQTIGAINQAVTGGLVTGGLASLGGKSAALPGMAQNALAQYGATPVRDAVTAGTAAAAGEGARASGAGPAGQFAATLAGGFTPAAGAGLVQRAASRGAKPNALAAEVMGPFERSNVPMRQADFDPAARPQRAALEKSEKGRPIIQAADEADQAAMEARLSEIGGAGRVADSPYETGAMVQGALTRQGDRTKTAARARYERAEKLSGNPAIEPTQAIGATVRHVADLQASGTNTNAAEIKFLTGLGEDLSAPGGKTISQLRDLRTNLRGRLKEQGLDHGQAEARALSIMDAASADIEAGLKGNPRALEQYKLGDKIWRERADFRKNVTAQLIGKNGEKSAIDTATAVNLLAKKDPMRFKRLMDEFEPEERADFVATIAANLGRNGKGEFSPAILLNNLDPRTGKISPEALRMMLGSDGMKAMKDLQVVARQKIAARSDTAPSGASIQNMKRGLRSAIFAGMGFSTGGVGGAVAAPVVEGFFANLSDARKARLLTNPVFTKQLRNAPETTNPKAINTYFDRMTQSAAKSPVFAMDVEAFKQALAGAASKSTTAAAAGEQEQN